MLPPDRSRLGSNTATRNVWRCRRGNLALERIAVAQEFDRLPALGLVDMAVVQHDAAWHRGLAAQGDCERLAGAEPLRWRVLGRNRRANRLGGGDLQRALGGGRIDRARWSWRRFEAFAQVGNVLIEGRNAIEPVAAEPLCSAGTVGDIGNVNTLSALGHRGPGVAPFGVAGDGGFAGGAVAGARVNAPQNGAAEFAREEKREPALDQDVFFDAAKRGRGCGRTSWVRAAARCSEEVAAISSSHCATSSGEYLPVALPATRASPHSSGDSKS